MTDANEEPRRRALLFTFEDWPLARPLAHAYGLSERWQKAPIYFATIDAEFKRSDEVESSAEEDELVVAVISQLAQSFLRDPEVREGFYEGGKRTLFYSTFLGVGTAAIEEELMEAGFDVWTIAELLEKRAANEPETLDVEAIWSEGVVDRFAAYAERVGADAAWSEVMTHRGYDTGLNSVAYRALGKLDDPSAFAGHASRGTLSSLGKLVMGRGKHPFVARRLVELAKSDVFDGVLCYEWLIDELKQIVPDEAATLPTEEPYVAPEPIEEEPPLSPWARWQDLARDKQRGRGSREGDAELVELTPATMSTCEEDPGDLFQVLEVVGPLDADAIWRGLLSITAREDAKARSILLEVLGEAIGTFPPAPPSDPALAAKVKEALANAPAHVAERLTPRTPGEAVTGHIAVDGGLVAIASAALLREDPPTSEQAWREAHERNDAAVFELGGDGGFEFSVEIGPPPAGADVVCWAVSFRGGGVLYAGMDSASIGPLSEMHQVAALRDGGALRFFISAEPTTPPTEGFPLSLR